MEITSTSGKTARSVHRRARAWARGEKDLLFEFFNERNLLSASTRLRTRRYTLTDSPSSSQGSTSTRAGRWFLRALMPPGKASRFSQFYSVLDLLDTNDPLISKSKARKFLLKKLKFNPWLRALALSQRSTPMFMLKRK